VKEEISRKLAFHQLNKIGGRSKGIFKGEDF
jgi:hypothetical protein